MNARCLVLRRPVTLSMTEGPFVPEGDPGILEEVDRRWDALCVANPAYFDGRLCHVIGVHRNGAGGAVLHVADCAYRFFAVQDDDLDLGVRPLGVKGITRRGRPGDIVNDHVLLGRRAAHIAGYPGQWEFAPGGVVEPGRTPEATVTAELLAETGLAVARGPSPVALLFDDVLQCWELVFLIDAQTLGDADPPPTDEYTELAWRRSDDLALDLTPLARRMITLLPPVARA